MFRTQAISRCNVWKNEFYDLHNEPAPIHLFFVMTDTVRSRKQKPPAFFMAKVLHFCAVQAIIVLYFAKMVRPPPFSLPFCVLTGGGIG